MDSFLVTMVGGGKPPPPSYHLHRDENYIGQRISHGRLISSWCCIARISPSMGRNESENIQKAPHDGSWAWHKKPLP